MNQRIAYVIYNTNPNRLCYYEDADGNRHVPEWLRGDCAMPTGPGAPLMTTNDLTLATILFEDQKELGEEMAKRATACYGYEGYWFTQGGARYPDSCTTVDDYNAVAPKFELKQVTLTVEMNE